MESSDNLQASGGRIPRLVIWAFCLALILRLAYVLMLEVPTGVSGLSFDDERVYVTVAANFRSGYGFAQEPGFREATKTPGYPFILALCNPHEDFPTFVRTARVVQCIVSAATCLLVWLLARRLFGDAAGVVAAWIAAVYPFFIYFCGVLLSETFFIAVFLGGVLLLDVAAEGDEVTLYARCATDEPAGFASRHRRRRRRLAAFCGGIAIGFATLIRPSALLFLPFYLPFWLLRRSARGQMGAVLPLFVVALVGFGATLFPWITRNYRKFHAFVPTTLQTGESLYEANSPYATGGPAWHLIDWKKESDDREMEELQNDQFWRRKAIAWIRDHPTDFVRLSAVKLGRFWSPIPNYENMRTPFYVAVSLLSYGPVMLLGLCGFLASLKRRRAALLLVAPILYYACLHAVFVGSLRYRTPIMPFIIAFAAFGLTWLVARRAAQRKEES